MSAFLNTLLARRSRYGLSAQSPVPDDKLQTLLQDLVLNLPTAFNMQSTRLVLLLGEEHKALWDIAADTLRKTVPAENFPRTQAKLNAFAAGHGSLLFFDDSVTTARLKAENPLYSDNFEPWALQQNGMLQLGAWGLLTELGLGASLQHYNPLIDDAVKTRYALPAEWTLLAQMPFGQPTAPPNDKTFLSLDTRFRRLG